MNINFSKLQLLYNIVNYIAEARQQLIKDLVGYVDDPVRYKRRMRFLIHLAEYERNLLTKLHHLDHDDPEYYNEKMLRQLKDEVDLVTSRSA